MGSKTLAHAIRTLEVRASVDPDLADAVMLLAGDEDAATDPFARPDERAMRSARLLNSRRAEARAEAARGGVLTTSQVVDRIPSINDRKGVDRRRKRGTLLGWKVGNESFHPEWQFDPVRGGTWPGLDRVVGALMEICEDPRPANSLMVAPRPDLGGRPLSALLSKGDVDTLIRLILASGDQS